jgi:hypothetical protein
MKRSVPPAADVSAEARLRLARGEHATPARRPRRPPRARARHVRRRHPRLPSRRDRGGRAARNRAGAARARGRRALRRIRPWCGVAARLSPPLSASRTVATGSAATVSIPADARRHGPVSLQRGHTPPALRDARRPPARRRRGGRCRLRRVGAERAARERHRRLLQLGRPALADAGARRDRACASSSCRRASPARSTSTRS